MTCHTPAVMTRSYMVETSTRAKASLEAAQLIHRTLQRGQEDLRLIFDISTVIDTIYLLQV